MQSAEDRTTAGFAAWWGLILLMLLNMLAAGDRVLPYLLLEPIRHDIALTDSQIGAIGGVFFSLTFAIAAFPLAWLADRTSRQVVGAGGVLLWSAMSGLHALASSFGHLASLRAGVALGEAGLRPAALSIIGDLFPKTRLRLALAVYMLGDSLGFTLGLGAGGYLAGHSG